MMINYFFTFLFLGINFSNALVLKIPDLTTQVVDEANFFNHQEKEKLSQMIYTLFDKGGPQLAILTVQNLQGYEIEEFSIRVAEKWKLGTKEKDNGLLLVIAKSERSVRLEIGNGIEGEITDFDSSQYTQKLLPSYFKQGEFYEGVAALISEIATKFNIQMENNYKSKFVSRRDNENVNILIKFLFPLIFVVLIIAGSFFPKRPMARGLFSGILISLICIPLSLALLWYIAFFVVGLFAGAVNFGHLLLSAIGQRHSRGGSGGWSGGGGWGGGGSGGWSGGGGGFSGGGSSGKW